MEGKKNKKKGQVGKLVIQAHSTNSALTTNLRNLIMCLETCASYDMEDGSWS